MNKYTRKYAEVYLAFCEAHTNDYDHQICQVITEVI